MSGDLDTSSPMQALLTATLAGLSTALGGAVAIARKPGEADLAFLFGTAIGVMATVSIELWISKAWEHGIFGITLAVALGAAAFYALDSFIPSVEGVEAEILEGKDTAKSELLSPRNGHAHGHGPSTLVSPRPRNPASLLRLGLLMALTMTLHNLPEGIAVAFSSGTKVGPVVAVAIAIHNIPEGVIVALPLIAAGWSPIRAIGLATLSGLSETLGAALALFVLRPLVQTHTHLDFVLATVGGVMLAVCIMELWPEAQRCRRNDRVAQGCLVGAIIMGLTVWIGV